LSPANCRKFLDRTFETIKIKKIQEGESNKNHDKYEFMSIAYKKDIDVNKNMGMGESKK